MNFFDALKEGLINAGLLKDQAHAIMEIAFNDTENFREMQGRWGDDVGGYPQGLVHSLYARLRPTAYKWICENAPLLWSRVVFSPGVVGITDEKELDDYIAKYQAAQREGRTLEQ